MAGFNREIEEPYGGEPPETTFTNEQVENELFFHQLHDELVLLNADISSTNDELAISDEDLATRLTQAFEVLERRKEDLFCSGVNSVGIRYNPDIGHFISIGLERKMTPEEAAAYPTEFEGFPIMVRDASGSVVPFKVWAANNISSSPTVE